MPNEAEQKIKIDSDPDFIALKRFDYSLNSLLRRYPDGVPDDEGGNKMIAKALMMSEDEVRETYENIIIKLRQDLRADEDD
jgi:hypothetical protein